MKTRDLHLKSPLPRSQGFCLQQAPGKRCPVLDSTGAVSVFVLCLAGCDPPDYGDQAQKFVDGEAYALSKELVTADLQSRWAKALAVSLLDLKVRADVTKARLDNLLPPDLNAQLVDLTSADQNALDTLETARAEMASIKQDIEHQTELVTNVQHVCDSGDVFYRSGLDALGLLGPLGSVKLREPVVEGMITVGDGGLIKTLADLVNTIAELFTASQEEEQRDKFKSALAKYPQVVIQGKELFSLSQSICREQIKSFDGSFKALSKVMVSSSRLWAERYRVVVARSRIVQAYVIPKLLVADERREGVLAIVEQRNASIGQGRISIDLQLLTSDLAGLEKRAEGACNDVEGNLALEEFQDALFEAKAQLSAFSSLGDFRKPDKPFAMAKENVGRAIASLPGIASRAHQRRCK